MLHYFAPTRARDAPDGRVFSPAPHSVREEALPACLAICAMPESAIVELSRMALTQAIRARVPVVEFLDAQMRVSSAPSTTRLYRRAHHPPPMWGPDWLAMLRVRILRKCQKCGAPRNTVECMGMLDLSKSLGPLNMLHSCVILRNCAEGV